VLYELHVSIPIPPEAQVSGGFSLTGRLVRPADPGYTLPMSDEISINQPTITAITDTPSVRVIYRNDAGATFRVNAVQKPNPIGFLARLPGSKRPT
jgi:hypothetical protein